jgi:thiol-disulfide isomerase/thioredoxin
MNNKQVLSAVLTAIMVLLIAMSIAAATDAGGCLMDSNQEVQPTDDPLSNRIDDILAEDKSVFLFFYADWRPYCHQQMPIINELAEEYAGDVAFIKINVTERPDHAAEFGVSALPTMIMISGRNEGEYAREEISGFTEKAELRNIVAPKEGWNATLIRTGHSDGGHILDQAQEGTNYGFWFEKSVIRWQEFKPTQTSLSQVDLYIGKNGNPGNLRVSIKDGAEDQLWETTVPGGDIVGYGWVEIEVVPSVSLEPGASYYIHVWSDADSPNPDNRYFWRGQTKSEYDRGISCVEDSWPGYDFAFRTWGSGGTTVSITDANAQSGHTTTTPITINNMTNFGAATVTLSYDPKVVHITSVAAGDVGTPIANIDNTAGTATIAAYVSTVTGPDSPITFASLELLAVGSSGETSPLTLGVTTFTDADGTSVSATAESGVFTIGLPGLRGDANGDGVVNVVDAMFVAQYAVGNRDASTLNMANADANLDGTVNVVDAMFIAQYAVGARTW